MRVLCCGDRNWNDADKIRERLRRLPAETVIVHGGANGADLLAGDIALSLGFTVEGHPAEWSRYHRAAGPIRNQEMLDSGVSLVLAFHADLKKSRGTADMVRRAKKAGIVVEVIE